MRAFYSLACAAQNLEDVRRVRALQGVVRSSRRASHVRDARSRGCGTFLFLFYAGLFGGLTTGSQRIMGDPIMQSILQQAQGNPAALQDHMKNPTVRANIMKLVNAGIIKMR